MAIELLEGGETAGFSRQMKTIIQMILCLNAIVEREITAMQVAVVDESTASKWDEIKTLVVGIIVAIRHHVIHQICMIALHRHVTQMTALHLIALIVYAYTNGRCEPLASIHMDIRRNAVEGIGTTKRLANIDGSTCLNTNKPIRTLFTWCGC